MKNLGVLNIKFFFFIMVFLEEMKKSIYNRIGLVLPIIDVKMIPEELLGLSNLTKAQTFYVHKPTKVVIVD